jgi:hypothetical protein
VRTPHVVSLYAFARVRLLAPAPPHCLPPDDGGEEVRGDGAFVHLVLGVLVPPARLPALHPLLLSRGPLAVPREGAGTQSICRLVIWTGRGL